MAVEQIATMENIALFVAFVGIVLILYKLFNIFLRGILVAAAGFSFPWVIAYLGLPFKIAPTIENGLLFAGAGIAVFLIYEFLHFIVFALRLLTWPIRVLLRRR